MGLFIFMMIPLLVIMFIGATIAQIVMSLSKDSKLGLALPIFSVLQFTCLVLLNFSTMLGGGYKLSNLTIQFILQNLLVIIIPPIYLLIIYVVCRMMKYGKIKEGKEINDNIKVDSDYVIQDVNNSHIAKTTSIHNEKSRPSKINGNFVFRLLAASLMIIAFPLLFMGVGGAIFYRDITFFYFIGSLIGIASFVALLFKEMALYARTLLTINIVASIFFLFPAFVTKEYMAVMLFNGCLLLSTIIVFSEKGHFKNQVTYDSYNAGSTRHAKFRTTIYGISLDKELSIENLERAKLEAKAILNKSGVTYRELIVVYDYIKNSFFAGFDIDEYSMESLGEVKSKIEADNLTEYKFDKTGLTIAERFQTQNIKIEDIEEIKSRYDYANVTAFALSYADDNVVPICMYMKFSLSFVRWFAEYIEKCNLYDTDSVSDLININECYEVDLPPTVYDEIFDIYTIEELDEMGLYYCAFCERYTDLLEAMRIIELKVGDLLYSIGDEFEFNSDHYLTTGRVEYIETSFSGEDVYYISADNGLVFYQTTASELLKDIKL